ncbi:hypothetical protein LDENG_00237820 [Lucifuga dentata]|nr:hypothetical protein LDENG_00237820 [Lucifuga dentata]
MPSNRKHDLHPTGFLGIWVKQYMNLKGPYHPFCMFEPNIFSFHTCYITDNHFPKDKTVFQLS